MRHKIRLNVLGSKPLKDIGDENMLGKQIADTTTDAQAAAGGMGGMGPVLAHAEGRGGGGGNRGPKHEETCSNPEESCEPSALPAVQGDVRGQQRRTGQAGTSQDRARHEKQSSKSRGAHAYLAEPLPPKADNLSRREEARIILVRLLARRVVSRCGTASSVRKAA
jgi:hypothetical protein